MNITYNRKLKLFYVLLLIPFILIMGILYAYPIIRTISLSFTNFNFANPISHFVGLKNYIEFFTTPRSLKVLSNTLTFMVIAVICEMTLGLAFASLLNQKFKGQGIVRSIMMLPMMFAPVVVGYQWRWMFSDQHGLINYLLQLLGIIEEPLSWLTTPGIAMGSIIFADIWYSTPFVMIILLAALQSLPIEPYESAKVDGASRLQTFRHLTLPLIRPALLAALLIRIMDAFQTFDLVFILTYGGPAMTTELINSFTYKRAFHHFEIGYATAISTVALIIMVIISLSLIKVLEKGGKEQC